jgi:hypothetical protein
MSSNFIEILNKKFANQFEIKSDKNGSFISFPAKSSDFGDVLIYEECAGEYIVSIGHFTHSHFDCYGGTENEQIKKAAEEITYFLLDLFADRIICHGSHNGGGGWSTEGYHDVDLNGNNFVWSGAYKKK